MSSTEPTTLPTNTASGYVNTVNQITNNVVGYTPAVMAAVTAAEQSTAAGNTKKAAVMDAILGGSQVLVNSTDPRVASTSALIDLVVTIFNALNIFKHKTPATS